MKKFYALVAAYLMTISACTNFSNKGKESQIEQAEADICTCLTEPANSKYMAQNGQACNEAISREIGVADWKKVNMK